MHGRAFNAPNRPLGELEERVGKLGIERQQDRKNESNEETD
jgi:hypothetical protein